jgi:hypothetical protein
MGPYSRGGTVYAAVLEAVPGRVTSSNLVESTMLPYPNGRGNSIRGCKVVVRIHSVVPRAYNSAAESEILNLYVGGSNPPRLTICVLP